MVCLGGGGRRRQFHILQYFCLPFPWVSLACVLWEITVSASVSHFVSLSLGMERSKVALKTDSLASTPHEPLSKLHQKYCCCYQMLLLCYQTGYVPPLTCYRLCILTVIGNMTYHYLSVLEGSISVASMSYLFEDDGGRKSDVQSGNPV